ncbi:uncharacterized protein CIMG_12971 [Coccidioides immitis RS]|uniref:Histone H3 n=1 Tax=Coccidioides immitis (strain RS) TaxID=246410 RepID=J3K2U9_COCIM|nr:uncharacterized protein CIMG_12971 [Coccidioides immitis RS]EAS28452.3 hypothetical protein CIMG_12971 [Coccidioides immitis RS]
MSTHTTNIYCNKIDYIKSFPCAHPFHIAEEEQHKAALKEWALKKSNWHKVNKDVDLTNFDQKNSCPHPSVQNWKASTCTIKEICHFQSSIKLILLVALFQQLVQEITLSCHQEHEYYWQHTAIESLQKAAEVILCALFECFVIAMVHHKCVTVNTNNMKLILGIGAKIRLNYFSPIDAPDHPAPATTTHNLCAAPAPPTTAAATPPPPPLPTTTSLPPPSTIRVSACQMAGIRAPVRFTKPVLEEQEEEEEKKKEEGEKEDNDNNEDDDNND